MPARPLPVSRHTFALRTVTLLFTSPAIAQTFAPIPLPPGSTAARPVAMSTDGTVVVGNMQTPAGERAFRWSATTGTVELPQLPGWDSSSAAAATADASTMVGRFTAGSDIRMARWSTRAGAPAAEEIPLPPGYTTASAVAISADGAFIAAESTPRSFRIEDGGGREFFDMRPSRMSVNGQVVVGTINTAPAFWSSTAGAGVLKPLYVHHLHETMTVTAINRDGSIIYGQRLYLGGADAVIRWDMDVATGKHTVREALNQSAWISSISADGSIIAGSGNSRATLWHDSAGRIRVDQVLFGAGIDLSNWALIAVSGLSADGRTITGWGEHHGVERAWVATLPLRTFCYANCDNSTVEPVLNVDDFTCFINEFAFAQTLPHAQQWSHYANCDTSNQPPTLNVDDFTCFLIEFAAGCP